MTKYTKAALNRAELVNQEAWGTQVYHRYIKSLDKKIAHEYRREFAACTHDFVTLEKMLRNRKITWLKSSYERTMNFDFMVHQRYQCLRKCIAKELIEKEVIKVV